MKLALDTNAYSALAREDKAVLQAVQAADEVLIPLPVVAELRAGFEAGTRTHQNESLLQQVLSQPRVRILMPDEATTFHYARLYAVLRRKGVLIPHNDIWIAALVVQHGCRLLTYDSHFDHLPQVPRG